MCKWNDVVQLPINRKVVPIDKCIHHIVAALNAGGVLTVASCCGHGKNIGNIALQDGRYLDIYPDRETWERESRANEGIK